MTNPGFSNMSNELFTIGYASFSIGDFIGILKKYDINALVDVRSAPYSKFKPEFKKDSLNKFLTGYNITYIFLGKLVGARVEDSACYTDGKLNYNLLKDSAAFQAGINRILNGTKDFRVALMCAEKDPVNCHRTFLVCRTLRSYPVRILHILDNGSLEKHSDTEKRLLKLHDLDQPDIFRSERESIDEVYNSLCENIHRHR
jgi:uncharacterized protein (DUF488 family)